MNKTAIKNFAIWARRKLISDITYKAGVIGINEKCILQPLSISTDNVQFFDIGTGKPTEISNHEIKQRNALVNRIKEKESTSDYKTAFQFVIEEVSYTWFNRLVAIRFMEVNDYLPSRIRVLSSETKGKSEPDMVTTPFDTDMDFSPYEKDRIVQLKDENKLDELFRMLFIKQCNKLNEVLPELFEETSDYTEFLLNISFTDKDGVVSHLINDIEEKDFNIETKDENGNINGQVEIIGWLYQYYNTEPKDEVFALLKKNVKISKERISAATQLFTPDWIVRYMVENSLGRLWVGGHSNESLKSEWRYYLEEAEQEEAKIELDKIRDEYKKLNPEDIKIIDPCMGSGHILVYAFDVLMQIYESQGYTQRDAVQLIIENNLFGLDIDDRAYQLAYFAVMMKARKYDRRFFTRGILPKLYSIQESNNIKKTHLQYFGNSLTRIERNTAVQQIEYLLDVYCDAKEYGSILNVDVCDWNLLKKFVDDYIVDGQISLESVGAEQSKNGLKEIIAIADAMAQKYDVVVTNPPYMGSSGMNPKLSKYVKDNYTNSKSDLFAVFIEKCGKMLSENGFKAMITMHSWMFLPSYETLRSKLILNNLVSMAHLGARAFEEISGEIVQTVAFVFSKKKINNYVSTFYRLVDYSSQDEKEKAFLANSDKIYAKTEDFKKIPGQTYSYWASANTFDAFENYKVVSDYGDARQGMATGNNDKFVRFWYEPIFDEISFGCADYEEFISTNGKYVPYTKSAGICRWYGNYYNVLKFDKINYGLLSKSGNCLPSRQYYFRKNANWSLISTDKFGARYAPQGSVFDVGAHAFYGDNNVLGMLGYLNSNTFEHFIKFLSPTINYNSGIVAKVPAPVISSDIEMLVEQNITIAKDNWDSFELSWDFKKHPLVCNCNSIQESFENWENICLERKMTIKENEEIINAHFIDEFYLNDELFPNVDVKSLKAFDTDVYTAVKCFISYGVGCIFGRYSLDVDGLVYAGGEWDNSKYTTFIPDNDNVIPITDEEYFKDDIVGLFVAFVKKVYGEEMFEENLDYIAKALKNKGDTSREIIRNYFVKDFYNDHVKIYQKRPIYWLYDSGKQDGFKALIYMHRYNADTTGIVRVDYLHKMQKIYMGEIDRMQDMVENSTQAREIAQAEKRKEKLIKQLKETKEYDEKIAHIALSRIDIDLDDGIKVNYEKVQTGQDGKKFNILQKI